MNSFKTGVVISILYFICIAIFIWCKSLNVVASWNELGDFLAGAFSPVAFLWLVLGYLQQQKELQQNTDALRLQAEELKNSVEQYKEMVSVSKQQLMNESMRVLEDRMEREKELKPDLYMDSFSWSMSLGGYREYDMIIISDGKEAKDIVIEFSPEFGVHKEYSYRSCKSSIKLPKCKMRMEDLPTQLHVTLSYNSVLGFGYVSEYVFNLADGGQYNLTSSADFQGTKI